MPRDAQSSGVWLKSSSLSMSLSPDALSFSTSLDSLPPELRADPIVMLHAVPPDSTVMGERREYDFYGLEADGALRPGGQVKLLTSKTGGLLLNYVGIGAMYGGFNSALLPFIGSYLQLKDYQVRAATTVVNMAWNFKVFGGLLTDSVRVFGYRRKPYLIAGWLLCFGSLLTLGVSGVERDGGTDAAWRYTLFMALATVGYFLANVAADAVVVEIAQREPLPTRGHTQVSIYAAKMLGMVASGLFVTGMLNGESYGGSFSWSLGVEYVMLVLAILALLPLAGSIWLLHEEPKYSTIPLVSVDSAVTCPRGRQPESAPIDPPLDFGERCRVMWRLVQSRAMWQLLMFELLANFFLTIDSSASAAIEANWVDVTTWPKDIAVAVWGLGFLSGLLLTQRFFLRGSWGHLFCIATVWAVGVDVVTVACTIFEVLRSRYFWLYMQVLAAPAVALRFLVFVFPIVELAPRGLEGTTYGLVITFRNLAIPMSVTAYKAIDSLFAVSDEDVHKDSNATRLQVTYTFLIAWAMNLLSLAFVGLLPHQKLEVQQLRYYGGYSSSAGWMVVVVFLGMLIYTTTANLLSLFESTACLRMAGGSGC